MFSLSGERQVRRMSIQRGPCLVARKSQVCSAVLMVLGGSLGVASLPAFGQQSLERVEITGSAIRRIDAETSVPVTVLKVEELRRQGITTVEQVLQQIGASQSTLGTSQSVGSSNGGVALADLRGLGPNKTLVLLNGRRIANNAYLNEAPDLSTIPFAALERVEVLRDGASALYGTDAIGGVINFITRNNFTGGTVTIGADVPEKKGGKSHNANVGLGLGDLTKDRFNIFGFVDLQKQDNIDGLERPFNARFPGGLSPTTFPANYFQAGATGNPVASQPGGCASNPVLIPSADGTGCQIKTASFVDYVPKSERVSGMLKGTLSLGNHKVGLEYFSAKSTVSTQIAPVPYGGLRQNRVLADGSLNKFYPGNPGSSVATPNIPLDPNYFPAGSAANLRPGYINVRFRDFANGNRIGTDENTQQRFIASLDGTLASWDYSAAAFFNENENKQSIAGYSDGPLITAGVRDGIINPFGPQDAAGAALLANAGRAGLLTTGKGTVTGADLKFSREIGDWFNAGLPAAIAVGFETRKEKFQQGANAPFASLVIASTGIDPNTSQGGSRTINAAFTELNVPFNKMLDFTVALRHDKYSDFGSTTNPKFGFRFVPVPQLLVRGSYSTGFRAPSLYDLNAADTYTNTATYNDPVRCPGGVPAAGVSSATACQVQFQQRQGGNKGLKAEESKNATLGMVFEPARDVSLGLDWFWIKVDNQIGTVPVASIITDPTTFGQYYFRLPDGSLSTDGSACANPATCGYIDARNQNLGNTKVSGIDIRLNYRFRAGAMGDFTLASNSTWLHKYEYQDYVGGPYNRNINTFVGANPTFRWQSNTSVNWANGPYAAGLTANFKSGYTDQDPSNRVGSYTTWDTFASWAPNKALRLTFGVRNLFDRDPPYSNQGEVFQANYDPRFTDPTGRTYYLRGSYSF
jgi:iron complex outermembrane receptor protein